MENQVFEMRIQDFLYVYTLLFVSQCIFILYVFTYLSTSQTGNKSHFVHQSFPPVPASDSKLGEFGVQVHVEWLVPLGFFARKLWLVNQAPP